MLLFRVQEALVRTPADDQATLFSPKYVLNVAYNCYFPIHISSAQPYAVKLDRTDTR
jgi:hypothetical protein